MLNAESGMERDISKFFVILAVLTIGSFFFYFFYSPLVYIFQFAFVEDETVSFRTFLDILTNPVNVAAFLFSVQQAFFSVIGCLILGIPAGYFFARYSFRGKKTLVNLLTIPFVLPPIVVLLGFMIAYGPSIYPFNGIVLAHIFYNLSVIIRMSMAAWQSVDEEQIHVAHSLGASQWQIFWKITLPQIKNHLISATMIVFIYCFNSFAIVLYLGEAKFQTLEVRIYKLMKISLDFSGGASLAVLQIILNVLLIIGYLWFERKTRQMAVDKDTTYREFPLFARPSHWKEGVKRVGIFIFIGFISVMTFLPILAVIITSVQPHSPEVSAFWGYQQLFSSAYDSLLGTSPIRLVLNSLLFASLTALITTLISLGILIILRNRYQKVNNYQFTWAEGGLSLLILLPMATSSITLAIGLFLRLKGTALFTDWGWIVIILAHVLISTPFTTRAILTAYNRIDLELLNVASTLKASRFYIFRTIELPLIRNGLIIGAIYSFAISLGEFGATTFLARKDNNTLSMGIAKLLSSRTLQLPASMATLLILITFVSFLFIHKLGDHK